MPEPSPPTSSVSANKNSAQHFGTCPKLTFIENFLECTICLDFPSSPIVVCSNGHILCGQCAKNFNACPTCQDKTLSPSVVSEKLSREANKKIQCPYFGSGCKGGVLSSKFVEHVAVCYFRDIICSQHNCGLSFPLNKYSDHLKTHKVAVYDGPEYISNYYFYKHYTGNIKWNVCIVKFDDQEFLFHAQISLNKMIFYTWVSLLGDKTLADKYICEIKLFDQEASSKFGCIWTIPILPFHGFPNKTPEAKEAEEFKIMRNPMTTIENYSKTFQDVHGIGLSFCMTYEIKVV